MSTDSGRDRGRPMDAERLPTMPIAASRVIDLARRGNATAADLQHAVQADPASVLAVLAAARDGRQRRDCPSLRAAIERLGYAAAVRVCLEFRLADRTAAGGIDCVRHWRCAMLTTAYAGAIAQRLRRHDSESIRTAAALRCAAALRGHAMRRDESVEWLAGRGVNGALRRLVQDSHAAWPGDASACVALAACMAEVWLQPDWERNFTHTRALAVRLFGAVPDLCSWVFGVLGPQAHDLEMLLHIRWPSRRRIAALTGQARALLRSWPPPAAVPAN